MVDKVETERIGGWILVRGTWGHMASVSGFDLFADALHQELAAPCIDIFVNRFISPTISERITKLQQRAKRVIRVFDAFHLLRGMDHSDEQSRHKFSPIGDERHLRAAKHILRIANHNPDHIILLLCGEEQYVALLAATPLSLRRRLFIVLHQPASWLRVHWHDFSVFNDVAALICLSSAQQELLQAFCNTRVLRILHGVDLNYFVPATAGDHNSPHRLLCVGHWLRDFATLTATMEFIWQRRPDVTLDVVLPHYARSYNELSGLARDTRVSWHAGISAERLRLLYQMADLLLLPLIDATANNAVVESLACGLPIIASRVDGLVDNVGEAVGELCPPGDAMAHATAVLSWLHDTERREAASLAARVFAEKNLNWNKIALQLVSALRQ